MLQGNKNTRGPVTKLCWAQLVSMDTDPACANSPTEIVTMPDLCRYSLLFGHAAIRETALALSV